MYRNEDADILETFFEAAEGLPFSICTSEVAIKATFEAQYIGQCACFMMSEFGIIPRQQCPIHSRLLPENYERGVQDTFIGGATGIERYSKCERLENGTLVLQDGAAPFEVDGTWRLDGKSDLTGEFEPSDEEKKIRPIKVCVRMSMAAGRV